MTLIVLAMAGMALQDFLGTFLVVAEAGGRGTLAGLLDSTGDFAKIGVNVITTAAFLRHGDGMIVLAAAAGTSFVTTRAATNLAARWFHKPATHHERIAHLERKVAHLEAAAA